MVTTPGVLILQTRAQDPCSCYCRPGVGLRPAADHPQMVTTPGVWILRTRAQDPCSCCCRPGVGLLPAADHPQMVTTPGVLDPADPGARSLQLLLQNWCGSAPRRGPSANGYDAWRFGSYGPGRKILAAAACRPGVGLRPAVDHPQMVTTPGVLDPADPGARSLQLLLADLVWVCAPPRTIRKWLRRLAFWILRTRAQDPCNCCLIFRTKVDEKVDNSGWRIKIIADGGYTHQIVGQRWVPGGAVLSRGRVWPVDVPKTSYKSMHTL